MSHRARVQELCIHVTLRAAHTHARAHAHIRVEVTECRAARTTFCSRPGLTKQGTDQEKRSKTDRPRSRISVSTPNHSTKKIGKMVPLRQATEISSQAT